MDQSNVSQQQVTSTQFSTNESPDAKRRNGGRSGNPRKPQGPRHDSLNAKLFELEVGAVLWIESTLEAITPLSRRITLASRYPVEMRAFRFTTKTYTAVSAGKFGEICYLLRIERVE